MLNYSDSHSEVLAERHSETIFSCCFKALKQWQNHILLKLQLASLLKIHHLFGSSWRSTNIKLKRAQTVTLCQDSGFIRNISSWISKNYTRFFYKTCQRSISWEKPSSSSLFGFLQELIWNFQVIEAKVKQKCHGI